MKVLLEGSATRSFPTIHGYKCNVEMPHLHDQYRLKCKLISLSDMHKLLLLLGHIEAQWPVAATSRAFCRVGQMLLALVQIHHHLIKDTTHLDDAELVREYATFSMKLISSFFFCWTVSSGS